MANCQLTKKDVDIKVTIENGYPCARIAEKENLVEEFGVAINIPCVGDAVLVSLSQFNEVRSLAIKLSMTLLQLKLAKKCTDDISPDESSSLDKKDCLCYSAIAKSAVKHCVPLKLSILFRENVIKLEIPEEHVKLAEIVLLEELESNIQVLLEQGHKEPYSAEASLFIKGGGEIKEVSLPDDSKMIHIYQKQPPNADDMSLIEKTIKHNRGTIHLSIKKPGYGGFITFRNKGDALKAHEQLKVLSIRDLTFKRPSSHKPTVSYKFIVSNKLSYPTVGRHAVEWIFYICGHHRKEIHHWAKVGCIEANITKAAYQNYVKVKFSGSTQMLGTEKQLSNYLKTVYNLNVLHVERTVVKTDLRLLARRQFNLRNNIQKFVEKAVEKRTFLVNANRSKTSSTESVTLTDQDKIDKLEKALRDVQQFRELEKEADRNKCCLKIEVAHNTVIKRVVYAVTCGGVAMLRKTLQEKYGHEIGLTEEKRSNGDMKVMLTGCHTRCKDLASAKRVLLNIISPLKVKATKDHRHCMENPLGKATIRSLENEYDVKIILEGTKIEIYGHPGGKENCINDLRPMIEDCMRRGTTVDLLQYGEGYHVVRELQKKFGFHLEGLSRRIGSTVAIDTSTAHLYVKGYDAKRRVIDILNGLPVNGNGHSDVKSMIEKGLTCPACLSPPEHPYIRLGLCGHIYCLECAERQITVAVSDRNLPVNCAKVDCNRPILLQDLKMILRNNKDIRDKLIEVALSLYIARNTDAVRFCPTTSCDMFYYAGAQGETSTTVCSSCSTELCTVCNTPSHKGTSCTTHKISGSDFPKDLKEWMEEDKIGVRKMCPRCTHCIEKNGGCPHVVCAACRTNICWCCNVYVNELKDLYKHFESENHIQMETANSVIL